MRPPADPRTFVVVALGYPLRGRAGYRGLATVRASSHAAARALVRALVRADPGYPRDLGPVRVMPVRAAGARLLMEAHAADGARLRSC